MSANARDISNVVLDFVNSDRYAPEPLFDVPPEDWPLMLDLDETHAPDTKDLSQALLRDDLSTTGKEVLEFGLFLLISGPESDALRGMPSDFLQIVRQSVIRTEALEAIFRKIHPSLFDREVRGQLDACFQYLVGYAWENILSRNIDILEAWLRRIFGPVLEAAATAFKAYKPRRDTFSSRAEAREKKRKTSVVNFLKNIYAIQAPAHKPVDQENFDISASSTIGSPRQAILYSPPAIPEFNPDAYSPFDASFLSRRQILPSTPESPLRRFQVWTVPSPFNLEAVLGTPGRPDDRPSNDAFMPTVQALLPPFQHVAPRTQTPTPEPLRRVSEDELKQLFYEFTESKTSPPRQPLTPTNH
ncbi:hypothetical protein MVEN_00980500 [Mycena venus]|uniref:Uncharacterized protein n=1 Tax=Mycena venus TaxID=2733690 RepID=A0A8H6YCH4_9AGAR|nr:hypothetical protein MVEN_00980500 [Mycena venus]